MFSRAPAEGEENPEPEVPKDDDDNEPGAWEEDFKSHHDSKPNGPEAVALDFTFPQAGVLFGMVLINYFNELRSFNGILNNSTINLNNFPNRRYPGARRFVCIEINIGQRTVSSVQFGRF